MGQKWEKQPVADRILPLFLISPYSVDEKQSKNHPKNGADPTTTTYGATNSAAYGAAHASNYDQYGSR